MFSLEDLHGTRVEVELPLTSRVDLNKIKAELGIPDYVNLGYLPMRRAIVTLWAADNAGLLHIQHPELDKKFPSKPINVLLFGGAAVKIHCPSANDDKNPLCRKIKDIDFVVSRKEGPQFFRLLLQLDKLFGTEYLYFTIQTDKTFNAMRAGMRYLIRTIAEVDGEGKPKTGVIDILADQINLRHPINLKDELKHPTDGFHTVGVENMILLKCQFITDLPKDKLPQLREERQDHRILTYPSFNQDKLLIGMETNDMRDVCALLHDHEVGPGNDRINPEKLGKMLRNDQKLALTVKLNLENLTKRDQILKQFLPNEKDRDLVVKHAEQVIRSLPQSNSQWNKPWWDIYVATPEIFGQ